MNTARAIVNDMLRGRAGQVLRDDKPFSIEYLNMSIEDVQEELANNGVTSNIKDDVILTPLTPVVVVSPAVQCYVSVNGYFNGSTIVATPALPPDLIVPLRLWERQTGSNQQFQPMDQPEDGLPSRNQGPYFQWWEWREDKIVLIGSTETRDLRIRYEAGLTAIAEDADLSKAVIPIRGGKRAIAFGIAQYYAAARGAPQADWAEKQKDEKIYQLVNRYVRKDQRIAFRPRAFNSNTGSVDDGLGGDFR